MTFALLTKAELTSKISGIATTTKTLREDIHIVLCHSAGHAFEHGDVTNFTRLFDATSGMARKQMAAWIKEFGFAVLQKDGTYKLDKKARNEMREQEAFKDGAECAEYLLAERKWYVKEDTAEQIVNALDVAKRLEALAKQIEKASKDDKPLTISGEAIALAMGKVKTALIAANEKRVRANAAPRREPNEFNPAAIAAE